MNTTHITECISLILSGNTILLQLPKKEFSQTHQKIVEHIRAIQEVTSDRLAYYVKGAKGKGVNFSRDEQICTVARRDRRMKLT